MRVSYFIACGVLLLQASLSYATKCTVQSGVKIVDCPSGPGGGGTGHGGKGGGDAIDIIPCTFYTYSGPGAQTYHVQTNLEYSVLIDDLFVVGNDKITVRKFWCRPDGEAAEKCVVHTLDRNAWPPIMLKKGHGKRLCINGGKHSKLKFKIVTTACDKCADWKYNCLSPEQCTRDGGMYLKKPDGLCKGDDVCCNAMPCETVHFAHGKRCVPRNTLPPFPKQCPQKCQTTFPCPQGKNCCDLCEAYNGIYTCKAAGDCKSGIIMDNKCCNTASDVCCLQH